MTTGSRQKDLDTKKNIAQRIWCIIPMTEFEKDRYQKKLTVRRVEEDQKYSEGLLYLSEYNFEFKILFSAGKKR